ncbi:esterase/lipase [Formosa sp. Hel1_33_131]|uniref:alpha/beta hydrolase n=1 Tax=Formosa sp. Hel1_33_131 TaxID=1336794 RepID=UPI00084E1EF4|nr:alpha/beta hydrolase [Formosa sp. Hel1_33_131]AOR27355.1 esterase/lipase [Formosa sp. Hel1_33_131]
MKKAIRSILVIIACCFVLKSTAQKTIDTIATKVDGFDIPIRIKLPKNTTGKNPVYFFVHGGGWNGGTETTVPPARLSTDANYLANQLGVIYVGLAYRCKGNNATFADAIQDLEASVQWFFENADTYNADLTRIGFGGSSAGSTLAAMMAQKYKNCKLFVGAEGMYNLVEHSEERSTFPSQKARELYGLATEKESKKASAFYNLRENPPSTLLLNGKEDDLCHYTQTEKFAEQIKKKGGNVKVVLYDAINHTCLNASYPEVLKNSVLEIAKIFIEEFQLENKNRSQIEVLLDKRLQGMYPKESIAEDDILGAWEFKKFILTLNKNGQGSLLNSKNNSTKIFTYTLEKDSITFKVNGKTKIFYMRKNNRVIYEYNFADERFKYRRLNYKKVS